MKQAVEGMHKCSKDSIACVLLGTGRIPNPIVFIKAQQQFVVLLMKTEMFQKKKNYVCAGRGREREQKVRWVEKCTVCLACINLPM